MTKFLNEIMDKSELEELKESAYNSTERLVNEIKEAIQETNRTHTSLAKEVGSSPKTITYILNLNSNNLYLLNLLAQGILGKELVFSEDFNKISISNKWENIDPFKKAAIIQFDKFVDEIKEKLIELEYSYDLLSEMLNERITNNLFKSNYSKTKYNPIITFIVMGYKYDKLLKLVDIQETVIKTQKENKEDYIHEGILVEENNNQEEPIDDLEKVSENNYDSAPEENEADIVFENVDLAKAKDTVVLNDLIDIIYKIQSLFKLGYSSEAIKASLSPTKENYNESIKNLINNHYSDIKQSIHDYEDSKIKELLYSISEQEQKDDLNDIQYDTLRQVRKLENNVFNSLKRNGLEL